MDVWFENKYMETDKMVLEYSAKVGCSKAILFRMILAFVSLLALAYFLRIRSTDLAVYAAFLTLYWLGCAVAAPYLTLRRVKKNNRALFDGKTYEEIVRFGDNIAISKGTSSMVLEYSQIIRMIRLKHSIALKFGKNISILLDPAGFTVGDPGQFEGFIRERCENLK